MYGNHRPRYRGGGEGTGGGQPPSQPLTPQYNPNFAFQNPNIFFPNPAVQLLQNLTNIPFQNPNFDIQNPNSFMQNANLLVQNANLPPQQPPSNASNQQRPQSQHHPLGASNQQRPLTQQPRSLPSQPQKLNKEVVERIDRAVVKSRSELIMAGKSVNSWKVSRSALLKLQVDSWSSLGFQMQEVPSIHKLMVTEARINAFIHCFVGVRQITSLYDLEEAICKSEGIEKFEELELGPFLRQPLISHYFLVKSDVDEVFKIATDDIIVYLSEYTDAHKGKDIKVDEFLDFIAKKRSLASKEKLGVRIQNLGMHINFIREARKSQDVTLKKFFKELQPDHKRRKRPVFSSEKKKQLDERFSAICERVKSFSSINEDFGAKHIRFISSSSEGEDSDDCTYECSNDINSNVQLPLQSKGSDRVSSCPYPSVSEEMKRLGLKGEINHQLTSVGNSSRQDEYSGSSKKKRKIENSGCTSSAPAKLLRSNKAKRRTLPIESSEQAQDDELNEADISLSNESMSMFITTWKEACKNHTMSEVLEKMVQFYKPTDPKRVAQYFKRMKLMLSSYPCIGLLNIAVTSIKCGMWDSVYDTLQSITQEELNNTVSENSREYESIEIEPSEQVAVAYTKRTVQDIQGVTVEEVMKKVSKYLEFDDSILNNAESPVTKIIVLLRKLCSCETWLAEQFCIDEFKSLGYGEFFTFLEKHASMLSTELQKFFTDDTIDRSPLEVSLDQHLLVVLVSQASNNLWGNEIITKQMISELLTRQFPLISFKIEDKVSMESFLETVGKYRNEVISKCVIFSETILGTRLRRDLSVHGENSLLETTSVITHTGLRTKMPASVTSKDAIEILLRAPFLSDLNSWLHWDFLFAPSLGPLPGWLLNEVNVKELLCLVTRDGKVIRIDHSASVDSFLEAALEGSSFQMAVKLLSSFALAGGEKNVPLPLLKCHARHAFEVIFKNSVEDTEVINSQNSHMHENVLRGRKTFDVANIDNLSGEVQKQLIKFRKAVPVASRFFLDCLGYLPSEFRSFAADVLLSGLKSIIKDAPSAILLECHQTEQRLMLHEVGLSLGILEWIHDYHAFCSTGTSDLLMPRVVTCMNAAKSGLNSGLGCANGTLVESVGADVHIEECGAICDTIGGEASNDGLGDCTTQTLPEDKECEDAALIVESIRRDEFGLDPNISNMESKMLKKQHARLGRALHCLSQELYSQDSHFLLELVQNADDNIYPENVEPTLMFILQESGIIVLNNEQGFSAENIRALCDVGNSTKKGSSAGYIGQKGIGFKSVFRVTDAPEIHSNGFHVKFDISEGQIGFVLPTVVPPFNIDMFCRLVSKDSVRLDSKCWNTCIRLPFRTKLLEGISMNNIVDMFSDLHPSLLLFLHHLQCIMFRNLLNDSLVVIRKEIVGDGIIKVSCGEDKMTWFVASQKLRAGVIRPDVKTTEIALAFTLQESNEGNYSPLLQQQPVFAFLPLRTYGLKFIIQGDFVLPSSREEVDGNSPWNQWLLSEFPALFVSAERSFCDLPCFRENPAKAVSAYLSFVPLVGEVHGFFSGLPRMILSKLRMSNCLILEGNNNQWAPPCKVLRGWNDRALSLLPDILLHKHLGLGFLNKEIVLSDSLARALGIEQYGPKILLQIISSLCQTENGLRSMGLSWLASWLNELYTISFHSSGQTSLQSGIETDLFGNLQRIPFIPLSDGTFSSIEEGTIWLHSDRSVCDGGFGLEAFPNLCAKLRTVSPALLSTSAVDKSSLSVISVDNLNRMLLKIGVQQLSAHDIVKLHILPAVSDERTADGEKNLMADYLCFVMMHLEYYCPSCHVEREFIVSELRKKAFVLTNHGLKRPSEIPIHFSKEFGNPVNVNMLIRDIDIKWYEVDITYLKHPANESLLCGLVKWRKFFKEIGITDFVQVVQVDKDVADISHAGFKNMWTKELLSHGSAAIDWESNELLHLLSLLTRNVNRQCSEHLLEILDTLWDDCYTDKSMGFFKLKPAGDDRSFQSSFLNCICDIRWTISSMDDELHYPKELFHDCDAVHSILGPSAPYIIPKVKSEKLVHDIGLKTEVTIDDILEILKVWTRLEAPFMASIAQMSRLYTCIWNEMTALKQKVTEELHSGPFIFVPYTSGTRHEDMVTGVFMSSEEVYWHDATGTADLIKKMQPQCNSVGTKMLCDVYPSLHEFFVKICGVSEIPSLRSYLQILLQVSSSSLPSQAAHAVFQVFLLWADGLKSGLVSSKDIGYLKECLMKLEYKVLPTAQDKWVSLHPSYGLVCWCDDKKLWRRFKHVDGIAFLCFGNLGNDEQEMLQTKFSTLMQTLGIPALSEVVTREAKYHGLTDSSFKASLVNWALPYAQRYLFSVHPDKYCKLKQSGFDALNHLQVIVVEKLFYRNVIKSGGGASKKQFECSCLLEGNILYTTLDSDSHALYMELSRLFFDGNPELHLANFLHMITTMVESGSTEEQTEFFILNSQKVPKLPVGESVWSLSSAPTLTVKEESLPKGSGSPKVNEHNSSKFKGKAGISSSWPPVDWKTAPDFSYARANGFKTQAAIAQSHYSSEIKNIYDLEDVKAQRYGGFPIEINGDLTIGDDLAPTSTALMLPDAENLGVQVGHTFTQNNCCVDVSNHVDVNIPSKEPESGSSKFSSRDRLNTGPPDLAQALQTGKLGELAAFKHLSEVLGKTGVRWVNENTETGLPYDILIGENEDNIEYVEVKATRSARKDWFFMTMREWKFALEKGESFSIAHVVLLNDNSAKVALYKNPVKLCQLGKLHLVIMMPR